MRLSPARPGLSLMEIVISLTIFVLSFIALGQLIGFGADRALDIQQRSLAAQMCQSKLAEIAVGAVPLQSQGATPFDEDPEWQWQLDAEPGSVTGLYTVQVKVFRPRSDGSEIAVSMTRLVLDPSLRGSAFDQPATVIASNSSSSSGSSGSSSTTGQGTQGSQSSPSSGTSSPATGSSSSSGSRPATTPAASTPAAPAAGGGTGGRGTTTPAAPAASGGAGGRGTTTPAAPSAGGGTGGRGAGAGAGTRGG